MTYHISYRPMNTQLLTGGGVVIYNIYHVDKCHDTKRETKYIQQCKYFIILPHELIINAFKFVIKHYSHFCKNVRQYSTFEINSCNLTKFGKIQQFPTQCDRSLLSDYVADVK